MIPGNTGLPRNHHHPIFAVFGVCLLTLRELAEQFVDEGLFDEMPEYLQFYIDCGAIVREDFCETTVADGRLIYRAF